MKKTLRILLLIVIILAACMIKETSIVMIPISLLWFFASGINLRWNWRKVIRSKELVFFISVLISGITYYFLRTFSLQNGMLKGSYTQNFSFSLPIILTSSSRWAMWLIRDFLMIVPLIFFYIYYIKKNEVKSKDEKVLLYSIIWMALWLGVYTPWLYTAEYYLVPFALGFAVFCGIIIAYIEKAIKSSYVYQKKLALFTLIITFLLWAPTLGNNYTNMRIQMIADKMNSELLDFIALNLSDSDKILIDYPEESEYIEQMNLILAVQKKRPDIKISPLSQHLGRFNLGERSSVYILSNDIDNSIIQSVRLGIYDTESNNRWEELEELLNGDGEIIYQNRHNNLSLYIDYPHLLCLWFDSEYYCPNQNPPIDTREFSYGWRVIHLDQ